MHPLEQRLIACLEAGGEPDPSDFGGIGALAAAADDIAASPLIPEFLRMSLPVLASPEDAFSAAQFICRCIEGATHDFVWTEIVDILDEASTLPLLERCFSRFLAVAGDRDLAPMTRAAALDGALRWATADRKRQLRLSLVLLDIMPDDDPTFLARAAKIMGIAYSHWREQELLSNLLQLSHVDGAADEAAFELGMANLADGLDASDPATAALAFETARQWFTQAASCREQRPDARLYAGCLESLALFSSGSAADHLNTLAKSLSADAFELHAWHTSSVDPPWLGARHAEAVTWEMLALKMNGLAGHLDAGAWWEPAIIIEQYLLTAYCAGRAILRRPRGAGVETMIRPRIEGSLVNECYQAQLLKKWLSLNSEDEWRPEAEALAARVDVLMSEKLTNCPYEAATERPTVAALLNEAKLPPTTKDIITDAMSVHLGNMTAAEEMIIQRCTEAAWNCSDYRDNKSGRVLFNAILVWTIRFLFCRLELTTGYAPAIKYLFERSDKSLPHEQELHDDYYNFIHSNITGTEIEVSNVGGGRADLRFSYRPERLVVEVKREDRNASFEALEQYYIDQTIDYQNVSIRLGFLLVLDLSEMRNSGTTPHISSLVRPIMVEHIEESERRLVIIVKVPGRRLPPSDLTKSNKSKRSGSKLPRSTLQTYPHGWLLMAPTGTTIPDRYHG